MNDQGKKSPHWAAALATMAGLGHFPFAPGTVGTAGAIVVYLLLARLPIYGYVLCWFALFVVSCYAAQLVQEARGEADPGIVVVDEALGFFAAMFLLPCQWQYIVAAFFIFRLLDIIKPYPARYFDREVKNGFGIVMDDVAAGLYTNLIIQVAVLLFW